MTTMYDNFIQQFFHCGECLRELPADQSPESYARLSIGYTKHGLQVWCVRHKMNVAHFNFTSIDEPIKCLIDREGDWGKETKEPILQ